MSNNERSGSVARAVHKHARRPRNVDARVRRTHQRLGRALVELLQQKPLHVVRVQEILDRAHVSRSTFYLHFRDKNDLLMNQLETFLEFTSMDLIRRNEQSNRVLPVSELFSHLAQAKKVYHALARSGRLNDFFDLAQGYYARGIEQRLLAIKGFPRLSESELAAQTAVLAGGLLSLLRWWLERGAKESPREMDDRFHLLVWKGLR